MTAMSSPVLSWQYPASLLILLLTPFVDGQTITVTQNNVVTTGPMCEEYSTSFDVFLLAPSSGSYENVITIDSPSSGSGWKYVNPGVWIKPSTREIRIHTWDGAATQTCDFPSQLPLNSWSSIKVEVSGGVFKYFLNGAVQCTKNQGRMAAAIPSGSFYAGSNYYAAANARIRNWHYTCAGQATRFMVGTPSPTSAPTVSIMSWTSSQQSDFHPCISHSTDNTMRGQGNCPSWLRRS
eukprot:jgi/Bigna1/91061/estExt_fgenesh1_pg.C_870046